MAIATTLSVKNWVWATKGCAALMLHAALVATAWAVPANPRPNTLQQPDGSTFQSVMRGDEYQGWMETTEGYTIVKHSATGFYEYAKHDSNLNLVPSGLLVGGPNAISAAANAANLPPKGLRPPRSTTLVRSLDDWTAHFSGRSQSLDSAQGLPPTPTGTYGRRDFLGRQKLLVVLVSFNDVAISPNAPTYWGNLNFSSVGRSVAGYYRDNSQGRLLLVPVTTTQPGSPQGVVSVTIPFAHPNLGRNLDSTPQKVWINAALASAANYVNFPALDTNGDGEIGVNEAAIYFVLAGYDTSTGSGLSPAIWAHKSSGPDVAVRGKSVGSWALNGERADADNLMQMGVVTHELGHLMAGLPDLYDTSFKNAGMGFLSVMATGTWGTGPGEYTSGTMPVNMDAWSRHYMGWLTPQYPTNGSTVSMVSPASSASSAVMLMNPAISTSEYWLVENRPPVGWDAGMWYFMDGWTGGLLIQHIDTKIGNLYANNFNTYVAGQHQGNVPVEPLTALCSIVSPVNSTNGCKSILFANTAGGTTSLTGSTLPSSNYYNGTPSSLGVTGISAPGATMSATFQTTLLQTVCSYTTGLLNGASFDNNGVAQAVVTVTAAAGCAWTASSNASWLTVTSGASGSGDGSASFKVDAHIGTTSRSALLTIAGQVVTITQAGVNTSMVSKLDIRTYVPSAVTANGYTSYVRIINTGTVATPVSIAAVDGASGLPGLAGQLMALLPAGGAATFSATQVEAALGPIAAGLRPRLRVYGAVSSTLEAQSFLLQPGGAFNEVSGMQTGSSVTVRTYVPAAGASGGYVSYLRVINTGNAATAVTVARVDPASGAVGVAGTLSASLPAGGAVTYTAAQVEAALGQAIGSAERPRLLVTGASSTLDVQSFLIQPGGAFTEVSTGKAGSSVDVPTYVPAASVAYTSFLRIINTGSTATPVIATLLDGTTGAAGASATVIASLPGLAASTLTSTQIEAALGVRIAAADRPRIRLSSAASTLEVQSFLLQPGGVYNEVSNSIVGTSVVVRTYVPAADSGSGYTSYLRVINMGTSATPVSVALVDGPTGVQGRAAVLIASLPPGAAQTFNSSQIEAALGSPIAAGSRSRIAVSGSSALEVQSFLTQPGGAFTEVSGGQ